jgi:hypothetical protein
VIVCLDDFKSRETLDPIWEIVMAQVENSPLPRPSSVDEEEFRHLAAVLCLPEIRHAELRFALDKYVELLCARWDGEVARHPAPPVPRRDRPIEKLRRMVKHAVSLAKDAEGLPWWALEIVDGHLGGLLNSGAIEASPHQPSLPLRRLVDQSLLVVLRHIRDGLDAALANEEGAPPLRPGRTPHRLLREAVIHAAKLFGDLGPGDPPASTVEGDFSLFCGDLVRAIGWGEDQSVNQYLLLAVNEWKKDPTPDWKNEREF